MKYRSRSPCCPTCREPIAKKEGLQIYLNAEVVESKPASGIAAASAVDPLHANLELSFQIKEEENSDGDGGESRIPEVDLDEVRTKLAVAKSVQELAQKQAAKLKESQRELKIARAEVERVTKEAEVVVETQLEMVMEETRQQVQSVRNRLLKAEEEAFRSQTECRAAKKEAATYKAKLSEANAVVEGLSTTLRAVRGDNTSPGAAGVAQRGFDVDQMLKDIEGEVGSDKAKVIAYHSSILMCKKVADAQSKRLAEQEQMLEDRTAYMEKQKKVMENLKIKLERAENARLMAEMAREAAERAKEDMMKVLLARSPGHQAPHYEQQPSQAQGQGSLFSHLESRELSPEVELSISKPLTQVQPQPRPSSTSYPSFQQQRVARLSSSSPPPSDTFGTDLLMISPNKPAPNVYIRPGGYLVEGANGFLSRLPPKPKPKPGPGSNIALKSKRPFVSDLGAQPKLKFQRTG